VDVESGDDDKDGLTSGSGGRHFHLQAPKCSCCMWKWFSRDHCCRGRSKPSCWIVEFNCTSTWLVWAEPDQTGVQTTTRKCYVAYLTLTSTWPHLGCDVDLEEGEYK